MADDTTTYEFLDPPGREGEIGRLGPYRVTGLIGKGGMGQVFAARDARLKREVALKLMHPKIGTTMQSRRRFIEEARSMAAVHHDNVATIFEVGMHRNLPFIAMEMLRGQPLNAVLQQRRRLPWQEVIRLAREVATGLQAAHQRGIIHRDIKPGNLWIEEPSGRAKILDFGLAIADPTLDGLAPRGATVGSPGYLSPEQARNDPVDDRTDLYSLGVVLYQACAGRLPLRTDSIVAQMVANICAIPRPLAQVSPETPQPLCELVDQLLRKEPRERPGTAGELIECCDQVQAACEADQRFDVQIVTSEPEKGSAVRSIRKADRKKAKEAKAEATVAAASSSKSNIETERRGGLDFGGINLDSRTKTMIAAASFALIALLVGLFWSWSGDDEVEGPSSLAQVERTGNSGPGHSGSGDSGSGDSGSGHSGLGHSGSGNSNSGQSPPATVADGVTIKSLQPLVLASVSGPSKVTAGQGARYELELRNRAQQAEQDPRRLHARQRVAARIEMLLQADGNPDIQRPAFPKKLPPLQLPSAGKSRTIEMQFLTTTLQPGRYEVIFELQTPAGALVSRNKTTLEIKADPKADDQDAASTKGDTKPNGGTPKASDKALPPNNNLPDEADSQNE